MKKKMNAMELTDKFSWRRVWMLWRLYLPSLRKQLWAFPLVSLGISMAAVWVMLLDSEVSPANFTLTLGISIMYYMAPIALARRDYRAVSDQMPVLASEKMVFLAIYFLFVTMVLTTGVQTLVFFLSSLLFQQFCHQMEDIYSLAMSIYNNKAALFLSNIMGIALPSLTLMGVVLAKRNRILMGVVSCLGAYLAICTISGILGAVMAMMEMKDVVMDPNISQKIGAQEELAFETISNVVGLAVWVVSVISVVIIAVAWTLIYKKLKRGGF